MSKIAPTNLPGSFFKDLDVVFKTTLVSFDKQFLDDLEHMWESMRSDQTAAQTLNAADLQELEHTFVAARNATLSKIGGVDWYQKLPPMDPLRGSVGLLSTIDLGLRETAHTRTLAWLLDPKAEHAFGSRLLESFLQCVFATRGPLMIGSVEVLSEYIVGDESDRLDIVVRGVFTDDSGKPNTFGVLIEAKIDAEESDRQCARYQHYFSKEMADLDYSALVFLTREGRQPESASKSGGYAWVHLSFLTVCSIFRQQLTSLNLQPGAEFLRLYLTGILKDLYRIDCGRITDRSPIYHIAEYLGLQPATSHE